MKNKVLVIVAHADDEAIGCGGTIAKHIAQGDKVQIIYMTNGVGSRNNKNDENKDAKSRLTAQIKACQELNVDQYYNFDFPDNQMDNIPLIEVAQTIESVLNKFSANIIYTHHGGDLNIDHRVVHQAVLTACRPQPQNSVMKILSFEVNSSTEWSSSSIGDYFRPNYFVDITNFKAKKIQVLNCYQQEMRDYPHSRSVIAINNLDQWRGNQVGIERAEAFMLIRLLA